MNSKAVGVNDTVVDYVRDQYAAVARSGLSNEAESMRAIASAFGYSEHELAALPAEANMGLSCGNPLALASVIPGEVVLDLGCGGGMDVFLAARKVGDAGKVIGVDMTAEMLARAEAGRQRLGLSNVDFYHATIDVLPIADSSIDCVISNCVINLAPDKSSVFREILRVLRPGGRVAISDIALKQTLPDAIKESAQAYVGCISGAVLLDEYRRLMEEAGFVSVVISDTGADLNAYTLAGGSGGCCSSGNDADPTSALHVGLTDAMRTFDANAYAASVRVHALKAGGSSTAARTKVDSLLPLEGPEGSCCGSDGCC